MKNGIACKKHTFFPLSSWALTEAVQFVVKGLQADTENLSGLGFVSSGEIEGSEDHLSFYFFHADPEGEMNRRTTGLNLPDRGREVLDHDRLVSADDHCPFYGVFEFSNVAGPVVRLEHHHGFRVNAPYRFPVLLSKLIDEILS